jgi:hypothetical protein
VFRMGSFDIPTLCIRCRRQVSHHRTRWSAIPVSDWRTKSTQACDKRVGCFGQETGGGAQSYLGSTPPEHAESYHGAEGVCKDSINQRDHPGQKTGKDAARTPFRRDRPFDGAIGYVRKSDEFKCPGGQTTFHGRIGKFGMFKCVSYNTLPRISIFFCFR